ncbi:hypothetical protein Ancab_037392 [Ancistrocladus abbreviatus]
MRGSGDFLTDFLKNDIEELDGLVYDEETDAMFVDICKGICSIKESDPIPSSIKLSGDFSIDLIEGDEVQKVDDAVYNEKTEVTFLSICKTKCDVKKNIITVQECEDYKPESGKSGVTAEQFSHLMVCTLRWWRNGRMEEMMEFGIYVEAEHA